ncbi:MAG: haloacid dehalogenase-like hydrolase [Bacilli bacterium]|nr:haloacid dehalogenase-like hydrolase [Bacilli bacterium]
MTKFTQNINIFDFDGTLTTETWPKFWVWIKKFGFHGEKRNDELEDSLAEYRRKHIGNELETFFAFFNDLLNDNGETISVEELMEGEKYIVYNPGVLEFLEESDVKNYIITGGLKDFIENLSVAKHFDGVYGTPVIYDEKGNISGIGEVVTDDKKVDAIRDILVRNGRVKDDCRGVFFIGDGFSDEDSLRFVHEHGGKAIFVHQLDDDDHYYEYNKNIYERLNKDGMIDYCMIADYKRDSPLNKVLRRDNE